MNKIFRSLICEEQAQLTVLDVTDLVNDAIDIHHPDATAARILGGLLVCGAYCASGLKEKRGSVSLTVRAKDADGAVSVSADAELHIRGYADGSCNSTLVGGTLTVVREDGYSVPYVGTCEITSDDVSDLLAKYFQVSEQIPTAVKIFAEIGGDGRCKSAGGVVIQLLPDASDEQTERAEKAFAEYCENADSLASLGAEGVAKKFFGGLLSGVAYELFPDYICNCSESKIRGILMSVGKDELLKLAAEQGNVSVHCHYCNKDYVYDARRIEEIFDGKTNG